jgi:hypothetical protein
MSVGKKLPDDAFAFYVSLGNDRSYQAVADHYGLSKRAIVGAASKGDWLARLAKIDREAQERSDKELAEGQAEIRTRHLKLLRAMASRAAKAIQEFPLTSGMEGVKTAELVIKLERLIAGEPSDRTTMTIEQVTRSELDRFLVRDDEPEGDEDW